MKKKKEPPHDSIKNTVLLACGLINNMANALYGEKNTRDFLAFVHTTLITLMGNYMINSMDVSHKEHLESNLRGIKEDLFNFIQKYLQAKKEMN